MAQLLAGSVASGRFLGVPVAHMVRSVHQRAKDVGVPSTILLHPLSWAPSPQMTYSLTRFAIYETVRDQVTKGSEGPLPFYKKVLLGSISGEQPGGRGWCR